MPTVIANWYKATSLPLLYDGDNSEIYRGDNIDATPMPRPPINRYITKSINPIVNAHPIADTPKKRADKTSIFFLPYLSLRIPETETPRMQPTNAELTYHPVPAASNWNCEVTNLMVPEITAVS